LELCPQLYNNKELSWLMDDPEMALEALLQLQDLPDFAVLEWPKGKKLKSVKRWDYRRRIFPFARARLV
jgi:hypothetical protein